MLTLSRIIIALLRRHCDRPAIGGDLADAHVLPSWGGSIDTGVQPVNTGIHSAWRKASDRTLATHRRHGNTPSRGTPLKKKIFTACIFTFCIVWSVIFTSCIFGLPLYANNCFNLLTSVPSQAKRLARKNVSEMTYFVWGGTNLVDGRFGPKLARGPVRRSEARTVGGA